MAVGLVSVPLTVGYLGQDRYGIWLTLSSLITWLSISDFSLGGNALINALAEAHGREDRAWARELTATAFWTLVVISTFLLLVLAGALPFLPLRELFNCPVSVPEDELRGAAVIGLGAFAISLPLGVANGIYHAYQVGYVANGWNVAGSLVSLAALVGVTHIEGGLPSLVLALWGARLLVTLASALWLFLVQRPWLRPLPHAVSARGLHRLMPLGSKYLVAQLAGIGMFQSQPMIISHILGPAEVGVFNVANRLLSLPLNLVQMLVLPLMPAYGEARSRSDWGWIVVSLRRSMILAIGVSIAFCVPLAVFARAVIDLWVGSLLVPSNGLVAGLAVYVVINSALTPLSVLLYGLERVGGQAVIASTAGACTVVLGVYLTTLWGLPGMAWAMAITFLVIQMLGQTIQVRSVLRRSELMR